MGSDRARRTYDEKRQYRRVIAQQGRAIVEADLNEAQEIAAEELRREAIDVIGPVGTPDDGYAISFPATPTGPRDFVIGKGTMYVGGSRLSLESDTSYWEQPDWHDGPDAVGPTYPDYELIYVHVVEQEVSAEEDRTLREVALGGPDTAQRSRLVQRVMRLGVTSTSGSPPSCAAAFNQFGSSSPLAVGMEYDENTAAMTPNCRLKAEFAPPSAGGPCDPVGKSGYLGAENQLIRVQISAANKFVWARDNASSMYRADVTLADVDTGSGQTVVTLLSRPIDAAHEPKHGQIAEVLRNRVDLSDGNWVAEPAGLFAEIESYDASTGKLTLGTVLPPHYVATTDAPKMFVRIWDDEVDFTPGTAEPLGETGLSVTLIGSDFAVGSYWMMALRPGAPDQVFPKRYLDTTGTPPEGPRQWLCPLGVIAWSSGGAGSLSHDCRRKFDNLVELTARPSGWIHISLTPDHITPSLSLQDIIDVAITKVNPGDKVTIGLAPGLYELPGPLHFGPQHAGLMMMSQKGGALFRPAVGAEAAFLHGHVILDGVTDLTLHGLEFSMAGIPFSAAGGTLMGLTPTTLHVQSDYAIEFLDLQTVVGVRVIGGSATIRDCTFDFSGIAPPSAGTVFACGVLVNGDVESLEIEHNVFTSNAIDSAAWDSSLQLFGVVQAASLRISSLVNPVTASRIPARLADGAVRSNRFEGLSAAGLFHGAARRLRIEQNTVDGCYSGFWVLPNLILSATSADLRETLGGLGDMCDGGNPILVATGLGAQLADPVISVGGAIARAYPLNSPAHPFTMTPLDFTLPRTSLQDVLVAVEALRHDPTITSPAPAIPKLVSVTGNRLIGAPENEGFPLGNGSALLIWDDGWTTGSSVGTSVILSSNWIGGSFTSAATAIVGAQWCAAAGNTIRNLASHPSTVYSLMIIPAVVGIEPEVAITGNTFKAPSVLPKRVTPAGTPPVPWVFFNSQDGISGGTGPLGVTESLTFEASLTNPVISQLQRVGTGTDAGAPIQIRGQQGQNSAGGGDVYNNDGGDVYLDGGDPGTGASLPGRQGAVQMRSNGFMMSVSSVGADVEVGPTANPFTPDDESGTLYMSNKARWLSSGNEFLRLVKVAPEGSEDGYAVLIPSAGFLLTAPDYSATFMLDLNDGFKFDRKPVTLDKAPFRQRGNDLSVDPLTGTATLDLTKGNVHMLALTSNMAVTATGLADFMRVELRVHQGYSTSGAYTITWGPMFVFNPTTDGTPASSGMTIYDFSVDGSRLYCVNVKKGL
ncbi:MAG: DUF6519 domain-containing protein [Minicystis sp.]